MREMGGSEGTAASAHTDALGSATNGRGTCTAQRKGSLHLLRLWDIFLFQQQQPPTTTTTSLSHLHNRQTPLYVPDSQPNPQMATPFLERSQEGTVSG